MGYIRHDVTVIQAFAAFDEMSAAVDRLRAELPPEWARLIVGPVEGVINGDVWWVMLPDGSKEGWSTSYRGEEVRARFAALAPYGAVGMRFGDEEATSWEGDYEPQEDTSKSPLDYHGKPWVPTG